MSINTQLKVYSRLTPEVPNVVRALYFNRPREDNRYNQVFWTLIESWWDEWL